MKNLTTRKLENIHIALWLLKDSSWCSDWRIFGMLMVIPTMAVAINLTWRSRHVVEELVHNGVVCLWICANITWMIGEFWYHDATRGFAKIFFYTGLAALTWFYGREALSSRKPVNA